MIESAREFIELADSEDAASRHRVRYDQAPEYVWHELITKHPDMRVNVVLNKTVPLECLRRLATDADDRVRLMVAMKRKLDVETFRLLAQDPSPVVRMCVANNRKTPESVLCELARGEDSVAIAASARLAARAKGPQGNA